MKNPAGKERHTRSPLLLIFIILAFGIVTSGYIAYLNYEKNYRAKAEQELSAVAELKVDQLVQWRKERLGDANVFYKNIVFSGLAKRYFANQTDADAKKKIKALMRQVQSAYSYSRICLHDAAGVERMAIPEEKIHSAKSRTLSMRTNFSMGFHKDRQLTKWALLLFLL